MRFGIQRIVGVLIVCSLASTCSQPAAPSPTPSSPQGSPQPSLVFSDVSGHVYDPIDSPVAGAIVQAYDRGAPAGSPVISDASGAYDVIGPFSPLVEIHVTKNGYRPGVSSQVSGDAKGRGFASVRLVLDATAALIAPGAYTLTITAGAGCDAIPQDLRTVVYSATVSPADSAQAITIVTVSNVFPGASDVQFGIGMAGQQAAFLIDGPALVRELPGATYLEFDGTGKATIANPPATNVTFDINGFYDYCVLTSPMPKDQWTTCNILPGDRIVKHTTCQASGFVLSATQDQGAALTRRRR